MWLDMQNTLQNYRGRFTYWRLSCNRVKTLTNISVKRLNERGQRKILYTIKF
jgi:hypothetical protein